MKSKDTCENCFFYESQMQVIVNQRQGECHAHPPGIVMLMTPQGPTVMSHFPPIQATHWCGEWEAKVRLT